MATAETQQLFYFVCAAAILVHASGCDSISSPRRDPSKVLPAPVHSSETEPQEAATADTAVPAVEEAVPLAVATQGTSPEPNVASAATPPLAREEAPTESAGVSSTPAAALPVRLSAGVALPQSLPSGTAMGFSVDYRFLEGGPQPSYRYLWVIRAAGAAEPWGQLVQLKTEGTLQVFVPQFRPDDGPFEAAILEVDPDGSRRPISEVVPLERS